MGEIHFETRRPRHVFGQCDIVETQRDADDKGGWNPISQEESLPQTLFKDSELSMNSFKFDSSALEDWMVTFHGMMLVMLWQ